MEEGYKPDSNRVRRGHQKYYQDHNQTDQPRDERIRLNSAEKLRRRATGELSPSL